MMRRITSLVLLLGLAAGANADDPVSKIANTIDHRLAIEWQKNGVPPAPVVDDLAFLRRSYLDLAGRIPTVEEARAFQKDTSKTKRQETIKSLLRSDDHAVHFASLIRNQWMPNAGANFRTQFEVTTFEQWLVKQLKANRKYDKLIKEILTAEVNVGQRGKIDFDMRRDAGETKRARTAFYLVADGKPEEMAAMTSRLFLGMKLECAQCHDHPFAPYTREQFWEFTAFFAEFTPLSPVGPSFVGPLPPQFESNRINIPNTTREVTAKLYADGFEPEWTTERTPRQELAEWLTKPGNKLFARNLANRLWAIVFGIGLIDPIDEPGEKNPPSHPELLDDLTDAVIASGYDLRVVLAGMMTSKAYQLSSAMSHPSQAEPRRFARYNVRGLTGHQLFDSISATSGKTVKPDMNRQFAFSEVQGGLRGELVSRFPQLVRPTESVSSILQSLLMMNSQAIQKIIQDHETIKSLAKSELDSEQIIEELMLCVLTREPTADERRAYMAMLDAVDPGERKPILEDFFWVFLNSSEFRVNH